MCHRFERRLLAATIFVLGLTTAAFAQKTTGDITGTVSDTTGGVLPGVSVNAVCPATNFTRTATTDAQGGFSLPELPPCVYKVTAEIQGFKSTNRDVQVAANIVVKSDFRLEVGTQSESVTVEAVAPLVEFSDKLNNVVDEKRITDMPLSGRDFTSLLVSTPGVQRNPGGGFISVTISGTRRTSNNYMVDGISNNDRYYGDSILNQAAILGVPATLVPMDAIAEMTVQETPSAEFGVKGGAAVNVVMKSGSNQLHGDVYYFRHDDWTDAPNFFVKRSGGDTTPLKNQQYGGTFGGPIVKDKTFFFGYFEGQRLRVTSPYDVQVPTPNEIAAARSRIAAAGLTTNPIGEALLKYYPVGATGQQTVRAPSIANMETYSIKVDHRLSTNNLINARMFFGTSTQSAPAGNTGEIVPPASAGPADMFNTITSPTHAALVGFVWNSTLSASTLLETRLGYNRMNQPLDVNNKIDPKSLGINTGPLDAADYGVPAVYLGSFGYIGGVGGYPIGTIPTENWQVSSTLTHTTGQHTIKVGGDWQLGKNYSLRNRARSIFTVTGGGTFDDVDSLVGLLLGRFDIASRSFGSTGRQMSQYSVGGFVNDDWKLTSRVTLNLGLRYDINGPLREANDIASNFIPSQGLVRIGQGINQLYPTDKNNFGPRAGFSWDITGSGKSVIRAGYALTYDTPDFKTLHSPNTTWSGLAARSGSFTNPDLGVFAVNLVGNENHAPDSGQASCINPDAGTPGDYVCLQPGVPIYGTSPTGRPPFSAFMVSPDYHTPTYHYFHTTFQRELFRGNAITISYIGSRGRDLSWYRDINAPPLGSPTNNPQLYRPYFQQFPTLSHIIEATNDGKSWYDAMQLSYRQNGWHGIDSSYNYTLSKCEDYNSDNSRGRNDFPQAENPYIPAGNKGPCTYDRRHNFNISGTYALPETNRIGPVGRGWQIGTVFTAMTGRPFTPNISSRDLSGQNTGSVRANCFAAPIYDFSNPDGFITNAKQAFATPPPGTLGNCGRGSVYTPGFAQWDMNILKTFHLSGSARVEARWEIFNLLNRVNLGVPISTNIRSGSFAKIGSTPDVDAGNPVIASGGPRAMQWALKILF